MSGLMIIPLPVFWTLGTTMPYILFLQIIGGVYWGAFELAIVLMFIEAIPVRRRTSILTLYYLGYAVATVLGSLVGGYFLERFGKGENAYFVLFTLSGIGRSFSLLLVYFLPKPMPHVETTEVLVAEERSPEEQAEIEQLIHDDSQISRNVKN
jgi:MFS family permease